MKVHKNILRVIQSQERTTGGKKGNYYYSQIKEVSLIIPEDDGLESMAEYVRNDRLFRVSNKTLARLSLG